MGDSMKERLGIFLRKLSTRAGSSDGFFFGGNLTTVPFAVAEADAGAGAGADRAGGGFAMVAVGAGRVGSADRDCNLTSKTAGRDARLTGGGCLVSCKLVKPSRG